MTKDSLWLHGAFVSAIMFAVAWAITWANTFFVLNRNQNRNFKIGNRTHFLTIHVPTQKITIAQGFAYKIECFKNPQQTSEVFVRTLHKFSNENIFVYLPSLIIDCTAMAFSPKTTSWFKFRIIGIKKKRQTKIPATVLLLLRVTTDRTNFVAVFANLGFISVLTSDMFAVTIDSFPEEKKTKVSWNSIQSVYVNSECSSTP